MTASNLHIAWARLFLRGLASAGVEHVVVSPGSRSTPLALAVATEPSVRAHTIVDERSAAFFALGQARVTGKPSAVICTSGTAAAHYLPAVVEASASHVPFVVVTADRPWEAYDCGAAQTIDQVKLFGAHARFAAELGLPDPSDEALAAVLRVAGQAVSRSLWPTPGAVHVNARFRKPLEPVDVAGAEPWEARLDALLRRGAPRVYVPRAAPPEAAIDDLARAIVEHPRGLLVCGPAPAVHDAAARDRVFSLARAAGYAILAEATSQLRFGARGDVCSGFDVLLGNSAFRRANRPDLLIELFGPPTSSGYAAYVAEHRDTPRVVVAPHGWVDPQGTATSMVFADPYELAGLVAERLDARLHRPSADARGFRDVFHRGDALVREAVRRELDGGALTEGSIAHDVAAGMPEGALLAIGNSMPIRDLDLYAAAGPRAIRVVHQRGANGIDGLVSAAAGAQSASGAPVVLLLGDLSLFHDLTGLATLRGASRPIVVVAVQNDGGRIFEELPIARRAELAAALEAHFTTPQGLGFEHAAAMFDLRYQEVRSASALRVALGLAMTSGAATLIEAVVPPRDATARRALLRREVGEALARGDRSAA